MGFEPNVEQDRVVQLAIRGCLGLFPGLALLAGALPLRGLPLEVTPPAQPLSRS